MTKDRWLGHLFLIIGALIYGANHTVAKFAMPEYISPMAFVLTRNIGACIFFWIASFFITKQIPQKKDYLLILASAFFGIAINQMLFFIGLNLTAPIYSGIIMTSSPIVVLLLSYFFLQQKIILRQVLGVLVGILGVGLLLFFAQISVEHKATNPGLGNFLIFLNATSYSIYLVLSKRLLERYHPIHFLKWIVTLGLLMQLPFAFQEFKQVEWLELPPKAVFAVFEVVVLISCVTYLLNLMALKRLKATTVSAYIFAQPLLAGIFALILGKDDLDVYKVLGGIFVLMGVYWVSKPIKENDYAE